MEIVNYFSDDILNLIFSYMQSNTNTIMKQHINDVEPYYVQNCKRSFYPHKRENHLKIIMKKSTIYGIKHFNIANFDYEFYLEYFKFNSCDHCYNIMSSMTFEYRGLIFCSEYCLRINNGQLND